VHDLGQFAPSLLGELGMDSRMMTPSLLGVRLRSDLRMAFSMAPIA